MKKNNAIGIEVDEVIPYTITENYILDIEYLSAYKKLFLIMLRRYAGHNNAPAYPKYKTLMKAIGCSSTSTILKCIDFFVWLKWIEKINRFDPVTKERIPNIYILKLKNIIITLNFFKENNLNFKDIEDYFEKKYKKKETKKQLLNEDCIYYTKSMEK